MSDNNGVVAYPVCLYLSGFPTVICNQEVTSYLQPGKKRAYTFAVGKTFRDESRIEKKRTREDDWGRRRRIRHDTVETHKRFDKENRKDADIFLETMLCTEKLPKANLDQIKYFWINAEYSKNTQKNAILFVLEVILWKLNHSLLFFI